MIVVYSFIGKLPNYIIDTVYQTRLFFHGDIYLILDDFESIFLPELEIHNVKLVKYEDVIDKQFLEICRKKRRRIKVINFLGDRKMLFLRSMERFFLLQNLMLREKLENILFLELDNLIYDDPANWEEELKIQDFTFMYDNQKRIATGLMYIKNVNSIKTVTGNLKVYVENNKSSISEMEGNWFIKDKAYFLPIHWEDENYNKLSYQNFGKFKKSIFDGSSLGIYFFGLDPVHKNSSNKNNFAEIDYTKYKYEWINDEKNRKRPYLIINNEKILINNLHIHCKNLKQGLSK